MEESPSLLLNSILGKCLRKKCNQLPNSKTKSVLKSPRKVIILIRHFLVNPVPRYTNIKCFFFNGGTTKKGKTPCSTKKNIFFTMMFFKCPEPHDTRKNNNNKNFCYIECWSKSINQKCYESFDSRIKNLSVCLPFLAKLSWCIISSSMLTTELFEFRILLPSLLPVPQSSDSKGTKKRKRNLRSKGNRKRNLLCLSMVIQNRT